MSFNRSKRRANRLKEYMDSRPMDSLLVDSPVDYNVKNNLPVEIEERNEGQSHIDGSSASISTNPLE